MKKILGTIMLLMGSFAELYAQQNARAVVLLYNPLNRSRTEVVAVNWASVLAKYPSIDTANFKVVNSSDQKELPVQLEHGTDGKIKNLLVQLTLKAKGNSEIKIVAGKAMKPEPKVYARFVPERYDDFAWENDKVAHRMYGKALESRKDNAYGTDVWVKRTHKLVIDDWYKSGDYHTDHGDGMDYYSVGFTLGAGDIAPFVNDSIFFPKNYHHWKMIDNGPLRVTFELGYDEWDVAGREVTVKKTISLDAGSRMNRIAAQYSYAGTGTLPVVIGIVKRKEEGKVLLDPKTKLMGYWEPEHGADGTTGVGVIVAGKLDKLNEAQGHFLAHVLAAKDAPVVYYSGSVWSKSNELTSAEAWFSYLKGYEEGLKNPVKISFR
jgi:hypothetical protein